MRRRFGYVNVDALNAGETGPAARGEEHELVLIWSLSSGKRQLLMDGKEIHFSMKRNMNMDFSFQWRGGCLMKVVAHAAKPLQQLPGFRQYEFQVNGQSFFEMPRVFELGLAVVSHGDHVAEHYSTRTFHQGHDYKEQYSQQNYAADPTTRHYDYAAPVPTQLQPQGCTMNGSQIYLSNQHEDLLSAPSQASS